MALSESGAGNYEFPDGFNPPYQNADERNEELQMRMEAMHEDITLKGVKEQVKQKELLRPSHDRRTRTGCDK